MTAPALLLRQRPSTDLVWVAAAPAVVFVLASRFELIESVDAWSIIFLTVPVTALMKRVRPIVAMTLGFAVARS